MERHDFKNNYLSKKILSFVLIFLCSSFTTKGVLAQADDGQLQKRVEALENYVQSLQPGLNDFANKLQSGLQDYTKQLETGLESYSKGMEENLDARLQTLDRNTIVLNPASNAYQRIDSNTGTFLIAVEKFETISNGFRLHLNIGNPNYADYKDFKLKLLWGKKWDKGYMTKYEDWRRSLQGAQFTFQGNLQKGTWTPLDVDLVPAQDIQYIECQLEVSGVQLPIHQ